MPLPVKNMKCTHENHLLGHNRNWTGASEQLAKQIPYRAKAIFRYGDKKREIEPYLIFIGSYLSKTLSIFNKYERFVKLLKLSFKRNVPQISILIHKKLTRENMIYSYAMNLSSYLSQNLINR